MTDELVSAAEAAEMLNVAEDRVQVLIDEGMLTPVDADGPVRLRRVEVQAVAEAGG